jgi:AAA15 family ATPase/GTPase
MKVDKLHIRSRFKNLENVKVDFDEDHLMTVVVGRNGSGKSNILEALVTIFRNLDLGEKPPFSYELNHISQTNPVNDGRKFPLMLTQLVAQLRSNTK